jgi:hypothetical protein
MILIFLIFEFCFFFQNVLKAVFNVSPKLNVSLVKEIMILIKDNLFRIFVFARKDILILVQRIVKVNTNYFKKNLFFHKNQNKTYYKNKI